MAAELLPALAERAGMSLSEPVRLEKRTREELVRYLETKLDEELPVDEARARRDVYALLGLVDPQLDLREMLLGLYTEQVAGFYEPDSTALFVMDDQPDAAIEALLIHELVHAVQDQNVPLDVLTDPALDNDRRTAAQAAIEGHATLAMFEYATEQMTGRAIDLALIPDFESQIRPALEGMNAQFPALAAAPRVVRESLIFPYVDGAVFVQRLWSRGERQNPFDAALPLSTEQILHDGAEAPVSLALEIGGGSVLLEDVLGAFELQILLEDVLALTGGSGGSGASGALASGWDGDRYVLVEGADGRRSLAWVVLWADEAARDRFLGAVDENRAALGGPVSAVARSIDGRPASLLIIGDGRVTVSASVAPSPP